LIATLVTSLLDEEYNTFLIDEPVVRNKSWSSGYFFRISIWWE
jgi:hypothetical protein